MSITEVFYWNSLFLRLCKKHMQDRFIFSCQLTVSSPSMYVSVSSVTADRLCQDIRCYISILNIQRTFVKLILLCSFNYEYTQMVSLHLTSFFSILNKPKQEGWRTYKAHKKKTASILLAFSELSCGYVPTLSFLLAWLWKKKAQKKFIFLT